MRRGIVSEQMSEKSSRAIYVTSSRPFILIDSDDVDITVLPTYDGTYRHILEGLADHMVERSSTPSLIVNQLVLVLYHHPISRMKNQLIQLPEQFLFKIMKIEQMTDVDPITSRIEIQLLDLEGTPLDLIPIPSYNPFRSYFNTPVHIAQREFIERHMV